MKQASLKLNLTAKKNTLSGVPEKLEQILPWAAMIELITPYGSGTLQFEMCEKCHLVGRYSQSPTCLVWAQAHVGVFDRRPTTSLRIENFTGPNQDINEVVFIGARKGRLLWCVGYCQGIFATCFADRPIHQTAAL